MDNPLIGKERVTYGELETRRQTGDQTTCKCWIELNPGQQLPFHPGEKYENGIKWLSSANGVLVPALSKPHPWIDEWEKRQSGE